jgi:hypothetical protein
MRGLRKNAAINAAYTGLGTAGIKSTTLHKSNAMAEYYAKKIEQRRMNERSSMRLTKCMRRRPQTKFAASASNARNSFPIFEWETRTKREEFRWETLGSSE